jgi:hypothetical protein
MYNMGTLRFFSKDRSQLAEKPSWNVNMDLWILANDWGSAYRQAYSCTLTTLTGETVRVF